MGVVTKLEVEVAPSGQLARTVPQDTCTKTFQCLVASVSAQRRAMLINSVDAAGWESVVCKDPMQAWAALHREPFQMAVVDLQRAGDPTVDFRELCEQLASQRNMLLMVCGNEGDALEEVWARQLGTWLYLPGVSAESDVESLCLEGRAIADRLHKLA